MKEITIDCLGIDSAQSLHSVLAEKLEFPQWYGTNLDALYDLLTAISEDTRLILNHFDTLGSFRRGFRMVLNDAEDENPHFYVDIL